MAKWKHLKRCHASGAALSEGKEDEQEERRLDMAKAQTWTRNISKRVRKGVATAWPRAIVNDERLESFKRRAEDLGLIIHAQSGSPPAKSIRKKGGKK